MQAKEYLDDLLRKSFERNGFDIALAYALASSRTELCDFQCNASFALAKKLGRKPSDIAREIVFKLPPHETIVSAEFVEPAFVNFKFTNLGLSKFANEIFDDGNFGVKPFENKLNVLMDYGGANVAKELHMGHLRSPIIGESLKRLFKFFGHNVISDSHLGDWGLQMGLTIAQLHEDGHLDFYFKGKGKKPSITLEMLNEEYPKASKRKNIDSDFKKKADEYTLSIQRKKEPFFTIYQEIRKASVEAIEKNYAVLNSFYDLWYGESNAEPYVERTVQIFKDSGLARMSEGALVVDVAREGEHVPIPKKSDDEPQLYKNPMPPAILKKYNDADVYATTDLATLLMRNESGNFDEIIYITDNRQSLHFEQVFRCAKLAGISPNEQKLIHIGFGTMKGADGKPFKTRSGETIKLEDIINLLKQKANEKLKMNGIFDNDELAIQIGVGAMKYGDLSNECTKDYVFDIDKFTSFEGKTGPYIQYTAVRIKSLLAKSAGFKKYINIETFEERLVVLSIFKLIDSFELAYNSLSLSPIANGVFVLASAYSTLYNNVRILSEKNASRRDSLLTLSKLVYNQIENALEILAMQVPDKM